MKENSHHIDKLFRLSIDSHEDMPSKDVWDAIENNLDKKDVLTYRKKNNWLKKLSALLLLLLLGVSVYIFTKQTRVIDKKSATAQEENKNITRDASVRNAESATTINNTDKDTENNTKQNITSSTNNQHTLSTENINSNQHNNTDKKDLSIADITTDKNNSNAIQYPQKKNRKNTNKKITAKITYGDISENNEPRDSSTTAQEIGDKINNESDIVTKTTITDSSKIVAQVAQEKKNVKAENKNIAKIKQENSKKQRFAFTAFYSPDLAFNRLEDDEEHNIMGHEEKDEIEGYEKHGKSFTIGLLADYTFTKHWAIQTGIAYSKTTIGSVPKKIYAKKDYLDGNIKYCYWASSGYAYLKTPMGSYPSLGDSIDAASSTHTLSYISIPLSIKYTFQYNKFDLFILAGLSGNYLTNAQIKASVKNTGDDNEYEKYKLIGLKKAYLSGQAGIGATYNFNNRIALIFSPTVRFGLTSINKNFGIQSYSNSFGLVTGFRFKF